MTAALLITLPASGPDALRDLAKAAASASAPQ